LHEPGINAGARAFTTRQTYIQGWGMFKRWCVKEKIKPLYASGPDIMRHVDEEMSGGSPKAPATMLLRLQAVAVHLRTSGRPDPFADASLRQLRTRLNRQMATPKAWQPFRGADLRTAFKRPAHGLVEIRDRAMLLNMYVNRLTPQDVAGLRVADVRFVDNDVELTVGGKRVHVYQGTTDLCPVAALKSWLKATPAVAGPLFPRTRKNGKPQDTPPRPVNHRSIRETLRKYARRIGINPAGMCANSLLLGYEMDFNATRAVGL
jgi:integrase